MAVPVIFFHLDLALGSLFPTTPAGRAGSDGRDAPWGLSDIPFEEGVAAEGGVEVITPIFPEVGSATGCTAKYN